MNIHHITAPRPYETNTFVLTGEGDDIIIIDPAADIEEYDKFLGGKVTLLLTHGHFDHTYTVDKLRELGATLLMAKADAELFDIEPDGFLSEGDKVNVGGIELSVFSTPGHSPGSLCFYHSDGHLFAGDTLFYHNCGRCDLEGGDYNTMLKSLKRLSLLPHETKVYPGHDRFGVIGDELKNNPYMR